LPQRPAESAPGRRNAIAAALRTSAPHLSMRAGRRLNPIDWRDRMNDIIHSGPSRDETNIAMLAHLFGIFTGFIGALVIWLLKKDDSGFIGEEAREALNFQITLMVAYVVAGVLAFLLIGLVLFPILFVLNLVFCLMGAVSASKGKPYRYPFALRLLK
jgi:uncharacterized protein